MKKIYVIFALLLTAIAVNAAQYSLTVKNVIVTDDNKNDILGDGKVKFDNGTNTLTFTDADITYNEYIVYVSTTWKENLNIKFEGKNTFTTTGNNSCISFACKQQEVKLWSDEYTMGSLTINVTDAEKGCQGIENLGHNNITLLRLDLNINVPKTDGIGPLNSGATVEKLTIDKCNVAIKAGRAALRFKEVELIDSHYQEGYAINGEKTSGCTYDGTVMKEVRVGEDTYGIWVLGEEVTAKNKHNILLDEGHYTMSLQPEVNKLMLDGVNINNTTQQSVIYANNKNSGYDRHFLIRLTGENTITTSYADKAAIDLDPVDVDSIRIYSTSGGSLSVTSPSEIATLRNSKKVAIKDCAVNIVNTNSSAPAFRGPNYSFISANFSAETAGQDVFTDVQALTYYDCFMNTPEDGFLTSNHKLASKGSTNKFVVVPGVDNIKPNFYYGDTPSVESLTHNSANIKFDSAMDNFTYQNKIKYSVKVAKAEEPGVWVKDYDLNIAASGSMLKTEITDLESSTNYIVRLKATDEAGNYNYYNDVEFKTLDDPTAIPVINISNSNRNMYNAAGMQVDSNYRGIIIKDGKKYHK